MADVVKQLEKLARYKEGFESETDEVMKAKYKGMIEKIEKDIAEAEKQVVKEEEKVEKKEEKAVDEVSEKIKKYTAIMDDSDDPEVKSMYQKRIEKLKAQIGEVKEQIKEEKKELQEKKDELKEAVKEVKEAEKSVRTQAIKKAEKTQVDRKEIGKAKKQRRKRLRGILTDLNKLVSESDTLRPKYQGEGVDLKRDAGRGSKPFGWRFKGKNNYRKPRADQHGQPNVYYEGRPNRADVKPKASVKLEKGGTTRGGMFEVGDLVMVDDSGYVKLFSGFDLSEPALIISKDKAKSSGKVVYFYGLQLGDGRKPFNKAPESKLMKVEMADGGMMAKGGKINMDRHIWEGWTVGDFIRELEIQFRFHPKFESKEEVKKWAMDNQPYYKKYIPEVVTYYWEKNNEKYQDGGMADGGMMAQGGEIKVGDKVKYKNAKYHATVLKVFNDVEIPYAIIDYETGTRPKKAYLEDLQKVELRMAKEYVNPEYMADGGDIMAKGGTTTKFPKPDTLVIKGKPTGKKGANFKIYELDGVEYALVTPMRGEQFVDHANATKWRKPVFAEGGKTQGYDDREDESLGMRRGKTKSKDLVGSHDKKEKSRRDDAGFEKRDTKGTWEWKPEAIEKKLIPKSAMNKKPSAYYRNKFPNLVMLVK